MKSPLYFVKLLAAFFLFTGMQAVSAQWISDLPARNPWVYSPPCAWRGFGGSAASFSLTKTTVSDCKMRMAVHGIRPSAERAVLMQGPAEYVLTSGAHDFEMRQRVARHAQMPNHGAAGFDSASDKGLRGLSTSLSTAEVPPDSNPPRALPLGTIKLVLMGAALALLVLGVGHKAPLRW